MTSLVITDTQNKIIEVTNGPTLVVGKSQVTVLETGAAVAGADGQGVPTGGTTGQFLKKSSDTDYDTEWSDVVGGVSSFNTRTGDVTPATDDYTAAQINASGLTNAKMVYVGSGRFTSAAALEYAASGTHLTIAAQGATDIPLLAKGASGQSANLQEWQNSVGSALVRITAPGNIEIANTDGGTGAKLSVATGIYTPGWVWATNGFRLTASNTIERGDSTTSVKITGSGGLQLITSGAYIRYETSQGFKVIQNDGTTLGLMNIGYLTATAPTAATIAATIKGAASQSANLTEWQNSSGTVQLAVGPTGQLKTNQTSSGTTLGSVTDKMPIYDAAGTLVGYVPIYDSIT